MTLEMIHVTTELAETYVWNSKENTETACANACTNCPYHERCQSETLFYGCAVWEESMGEEV